MLDPITISFSCSMRCELILLLLKSTGEKRIDLSSTVAIGLMRDSLSYVPVVSSHHNATGSGEKSSFCENRAFFCRIAQAYLNNIMNGLLFCI